MINIINFLDINNIFFSAIGYDMSYLEFFGTVFTILSVYLTSRAKISSWPVGIVGIVLYIFLFYQIQLYADLFEQVFFLITGFWGWWLWSHPGRKQTEIGKNLAISTNGIKTNLISALVIIIGTLSFTYLTSNLHIWLPKYFTQPASFAFLGAFTTTMSFVAQWMLAKKRLENWILWIVVDVIGVWLYWTKGVKFISLEYALFLIIAVRGYVSWLKEFKSYKNNAQKSSAQI